MYINKINNILPNLGFKGYQHIKNSVGETIIKFNYPYNSDEICEVQIFRVKKTDKLNYIIDENPLITYTLTPEGKEVNLQRDTNLGKDETFAYKIVRKDKSKNIIWEGADTGVKMRLENGEYVFRHHQEPKNIDDNVFTVLDDNGKVKLDDKGNPVTGKYGYSVNSDFKTDSIKNYQYTLVTQNGTKPMVQGPGYLAMPDTFKPGMRYKGFDEEGTGEVVYDPDFQRKMEGMVKTVSNMYGGSMAGFEAAIPELKAAGIKKFFTTPIANGDNRTSHAYYNKNNMQVQDNFGTSENYDSLMKTEFKNGINHVFDATLTSEGIEGIHVRYALRWGDKAQSYRWFRMNGLKESGIGFGVVPNEAHNLRHRIVNAPFKFEKQSDGTYKKVTNNEYNANQKTLLQIYDASQVTDEQLNRLDEPIRMYQELNAGKNLDITSYDDTTISYMLEINPNEYKKNIDIINDLNKKENKHIELNSPEGTLIASNMSNFHINKTSDGYVAWDDNPDMIKFNYGISPYDEKELQSIVDRAERQHEKELRITASKETQDMAIQSLKFWSEKTKTAHLIYTIQTLGNIKSAEKLNKLIEDGKLPSEAGISQSVMDNILNGEYNLAPKGLLNKDDTTIKALMSLPMDSLEFDEDTAGVLSTSYFSNRATTDETIGMSRFDLLKQNNPHILGTYEKVYNNVNNMFTNELKDFAHSVIQKVNERSNEPLTDSDGNYTEYGEYVIDSLGRNIAKYALLKSLSGNSFKYKILPDGTLTYDYKNIKKNTNLKALGINANNPTEEAELLQKRILEGLKKLDQNDINTVADSISKTIKGTDVKTFRIAEAIIDKSGLGLDFRLDAAKDVIDMDSVRNRDTDFEDAFTNLINFWGRCVQGIKSVNPHSFIVAEMTDIPDLMKDTYGGEDSCPYNGWTNVHNTKFNGDPDAMAKFYNETGITSEAAYSYFFTELLTNFSKEFERGEGKCDTHDDYKLKYELLINTRSADFLRNLYTFIGNHDKTRTIHGLAIDMTLFHSTLQHDGVDFSKNHDQRKDAVRVLSGVKDIKDAPLELKLNVDNLDYFRTVSSRAVAQTKLLTDSINEDLKGIASDEDIKLLTEALIDITNGNYMVSKNSEKMERINIPEISSLENAVKEVIKIAESKGIKLSYSEVQKLIDKTNKLNFENYLVHGDFDWTNEAGEVNRNYLRELLGTDSDAMNYSLYTVQIARMIKDGLHNTNSISYAKAEGINNAIADFVKKYNREKINNNMLSLKMQEDFATARKKNSYAAQDFRIALEEAFNQVEFKTGRKISNKDKIITTVYNSVTEPAIKKQAMMLSFLSSFIGIPTIYAGDEYGDTGYEDKSKNPIVKNRMATRYSEIDRNTDMGKIMLRNKDIVYDAIKYKTTVKALQNGTPYSMDLLTGGKTRDEISSRIAEINAICERISENSRIYENLQKEKARLINEYAKTSFMVQNADGDMAISIFNAAGIEHDNRVNYFKKYKIENMAKRIKFFRDNNIEPININNPYIPIQEKSELDAILFGAGISIPLGTIFVNADARDKAKYVVEKIGGKIGIVRKEGSKTGKIILDGKTAKNGVMVLRKIVFKGKNNPTFLNDQYNITTNLYSKNSDKTVTNNKLKLTV